jgi:hypothetical protein
MKPCQNFIKRKHPTKAKKFFITRGPGPNFIKRKHPTKAKKFFITRGLDQSPCKQTAQKRRAAARKVNH